MPPKSSDALKVDYDQIAGQYNRRYQANPLRGVERTLIQIGKRISAERILEVGCGNGYWLHSLAKHLPKSDFYGLDASFGMLEKANNAFQSIHLMQGKAGRLPLRQNQFDLIFCVNALHHFENAAGFIQQANQCLCQGGSLAILGQIPHDRRNRWYVYDYFEGTFERDLQRFASWGTVTDWLLEAGFHQVTLEPIEWISDDKIGWDVLDDPFIQKQATSQLALLNDKAYHAGIEKIKADLTEADQRQETIIFRARLRLDMIIGTKQQVNR